MPNRRSWLLLVPLLSCVAAEPPRQFTWEQLPSITGKTLMVIMPGGAAVTGRATAVEPDALLMRVTKTTDRAAFPKGSLRVPRATLHTIELKTKGVKFRVIGTSLGGLAGLAGGIGAFIGIQGGLFNHQNEGAATAAFIGIPVALTTAGYFLGNAADRKSVTVEVLP
jgi:hypothetical protein